LGPFSFEEDRCMGFQKFTGTINEILMKIAGLCFIFMVGITCADIILRIIWKPILGTVELVMYANAVTVAFALGATQIKKGHIAVDILVNSFSKKTNKIIRFINSFLCGAFFVLVAWQITKYATTLFRTGELSETLRFPYYPYVYATAFGCIALVLVFVSEILKAFSKEG
jgi:TRAP-type C4-dicarboxylate transport system permease small subunit